MIDLSYPELLNLFRHHLDPRRSESASFLIWYLENYYRLDTLDAVDAVCDQRGDKGVDGIYVNELESCIDIFQARISQRTGLTVGDTGLKEFYGTLSQFASRASLETLLATAGDNQVAALIRRIDLPARIDSYDKRGIFLSNLDLDANGEAFLAGTPGITFVGRSKLISSFISERREEPVHSPATFDVDGYSVAEYIVDANARAVIVPLRATELTALTGISNQSLFGRNVRGSLGNTKVNRDIVASIRDPSVHKLFPLFHNGITIICRKLEESPQKLLIDEYFVVNGCQSLTSLYENRGQLTDNLRVLTKIIRMDVESDLAEKVTRYSNNQNGVKARDFKSNHPLQIRLQNEFTADFPGRYCFEVKRGEILPPAQVVSNEEAGLTLMAFDLKEPWATHRKYQVFDEKYTEIFGRPEVTASRIVFCHVLMNAVGNATERLNNKLFGKYVLTRFVLLYMLRLILEKDEVGKDMIKNPDPYVKDLTKERRLIECLQSIIGDIVIDVNGEVDPLGADFDYRGKLRDAQWVQRLAQDVVGNYLKLVRRGRIQSLSAEWARPPR